MERRPSVVSMATVALVLVMASLAACHPLTTNPAGRLAYPGSKLTYTSPETFGDSTNLTRKYSLDSRSTAGQVLAWYTTKLAAYGYQPLGALNATSGHVSRHFEDGKHYIFLGVGLANKLDLPARQAHGGARVSVQALREEASSISVTIEDG